MATIRTVKCRQLPGSRAAGARAMCSGRVVTGHDLRQQLRGGTGVHAGPVGLGQCHTVGLRQMLVDQQALRDGGEAGNVAGQDLQQGRVAAR
jgi:hypothetical protein